MTRLGDVLKIEASAKPAEGDKFWLLNLDMVEQQTGRVIAYNYVGQDALNGSIIQFDTNCVLYSKLRPNLNKVVLPREDGFATSEMLPLRPDTRVLTKEYLTVFLRSESFVTWAVSKTAGAKMPRLGTKELLSKEIPLPSLSEQERIAQRFAKIDELIALRKEQLAKLDQLVKSRFIELFGSLNDNEKGLDIVSIEELCTLIKDGTHQTPTYTDDIQNGFKFLSSKDVMTQKICWDDIKYIPAELHKKLYATIQPHRNDILMSKNGVNYGVAAVNDTDEVFDIYVSLALLRPRTNRVNPVYLRCAINNPDTKRQFDSSIKGIGVPNLHLGEIKRTKVLLPPMNQQNQFVTFVEQIDKTKLTIQTSLDKLEVMKKALMQQYFG